MKDRLAEFKAKSGKTSRSRASTSDSTIRFEDGRPAANERLLEEREWEAMDSFLSKIAAIRSRIEKMQELLKRLRGFYDKILISPGVDPKYTAEMNEVIAEFQALTKDVNQSIKALNNESRQFERSTDAVSRIRKDQAHSVARSFRDVIVEFNTGKVSYKERCEMRICKYLDIAKLEMDDDEIEKAIENNELFNTIGIMLAERGKQDLFEDVQSRHGDLLTLEAALRELHEIYQDIALLIDSQGEMVDRIDANVEHATEYAQKALQNVSYAKEAKHRNIKLKIGICVCVIILVIFLFITLSTVFCVYLPFICR